MAYRARLPVLRACFIPLALILLFSPRSATAVQVDTLGAVRDTVTTASGLRYVFLERGNGPRPDSSDFMVIHGAGRFTDGTVFWDTRKDGEPFEYTFLVDGVIRGFREGMHFVREGDRIEITMKPELAYGSRNRPPIPPNSTLIFDYEILGVYDDAIPKLLRDGFATDGVDETLARMAAMPDPWRHYASDQSLMAVANRAGEANDADRAKVLAYALALSPLSYPLHQALAHDMITAGGSVDAEAHLQAAVRFNRRISEREVRDYHGARRALAREPFPDGEAALRRFIDQTRAGSPDYDTMGTELANAVREQLSGVQEQLAALGALQSLRLKAVGAYGADHYEAQFENGRQEWQIRIGPDGRFDSLWFEDSDS